MRFLFVALSSIALAAQTAHRRHPPRDAAEYAKILEDPKRDAWQLPHMVVMSLDLKADEVVADIGAGTGYFARRFAKHAGKVYAVDIDAKLLAISRKGAPANLEAVLATTDDPKLPAAGVDTIFFCDVLHHVENRPAYYRKIEQALKPGGRVVIVDFYKKSLPVGPPESMKLAEADVIAEFKAAGFRLSRTFEALPYQYFLEFRAAR